MGRPSEKAPGYTCPNIDHLKESILSIADDVSCLSGEQLQYLESSIASIVNDLKCVDVEDCRDENIALRDWGIAWMEYAIELEEAE